MLPKNTLNFIQGPHHQRRSPSPNRKSPWPHREVNDNHKEKKAEMVWPHNKIPGPS